MPKKKTKLIVERVKKVLQEIPLIFINLEVTGTEGQLYHAIIKSNYMAASTSSEITSTPFGSSSDRS
jgi:hypothetical protein